MFAKSSAEKRSPDDFHTILKTKIRAENAKPENYQVFITWHSTSQILLVRSLLLRK